MYKQEILDLLNKNAYVEDEYKLIHKFMFYLYTDDLDLIEYDIRKAIDRCKTRRINNDEFMRILREYAKSSRGSIDEKA